MAVIHLCTRIHAPVERVFDLSRSIDAHRESAEGTSERAVAGITKGLIGANEEVTWEARHFGLTQRLSVKVTTYNRPDHFQDTMTKGLFSMMKHDHYFRNENGVTVVEDIFEYRAPLGILGRLVEKVFLTRYMRNFLQARNGVLKDIAETDRWQQFLAEKSEEL